MRLRFVGELNDFLPLDKRFVTFEHPAGTTDTLKHVIESLGVPHTEIGGVVVNGHAGDLSKPLTDGDDIQISPHRAPILLDKPPAFAVDGHLGRLAGEVADLLPPHTRETKNEFSRCVKCSKILWRGSHHARMLGWIENLSVATEGG